MRENGINEVVVQVRDGSSISFRPSQAPFPLPAGGANNDCGIAAVEATPAIVTALTLAVTATANAASTRNSYASPEPRLCKTIIYSGRSALLPGQEATPQVTRRPVR